MRRSGSQPVREPGADRRGHDPRRHRRGVPVLQRQQRPAVRADLPAQASTCPTAANLVRGQRGPHRRRARRRDLRHHAARRSRTARVIADARAQARQGRRAAAQGLDGHHPPEVAARPQVRRDHARRSPTRASTPATPCRCRRRGRPQVEFDELDRHLRRADARGHRRARRSASAPRWPAAASRSTPRSAPSGRCSPTCCRSRATCDDPETGPDRLHPRRSAQTARRGRARRRRAGRPVRRRRPHLRRARRGRPPVHPGHDRRGPGDAGHRRSTRSASSGRSCENSTAPDARPAPGRARAAQRRARPVRRAAHRPPGAAAHARASTAASSTCSSRLRGLRHGRRRPARRRGPDATPRKSLRPTLALPRAGADDLQLPRPTGSATSPTC